LICQPVQGYIFTLVGEPPSVNLEWWTCSYTGMTERGQWQILLNKGPFAFGCSNFTHQGLVFRKSLLPVC
jgi:hypothetical protein